MPRRRRALEGSGHVKSTPRLLGWGSLPYVPLSIEFLRRFSVATVDTLEMAYARAVGIRPGFGLSLARMALRNTPRVVFGR